MCQWIHYKTCKKCLNIPIKCAFVHLEYAYKNVHLCTWNMHKKRAFAHLEYAYKTCICVLETIIVMNHYFHSSEKDFVCSGKPITYMLI